MAIVGVCVVVLTAAAIVIVNNARLNDSVGLVQELSSVIQSSLKHLMMTRSPSIGQAIGQIAEHVAKNNKDTISSIIILNTKGEAVYSTDGRDVGRVVYDKEKAAFCIGCHSANDRHLQQYSMVVKDKNGLTVLRNVSVIPNEQQCYGCHGAARINGKLVVDQTLQRSKTGTLKIDALIVIVGLSCVLLLIPLLSAKINKYADEIIAQKEEAALLYSLIEKISKTINIEELKKIVVDIFNNAINADHVSVVMPKRSGKYSVFTKTSAGGGIVRRRIEAEDPLIGKINLWMDGRLNNLVISRDRKDICLNISKPGEPLALINATAAAFEPRKIDLLRALSSHIAVAFENAYLYAMAITDDLTRLYTKRHFSYTIEKELINADKSGNGLTLLMIDLDDFKTVNDGYGQEVGDFVLESVAQRIKDSIREHDSAFRYGGEKFAVILPVTGVANGCMVADRIRKNIEELPFEQDGLSIQMTVSVGLADYKQDGNISSQELVAKADSALYEAKWIGKNTVVIRDERHAA